MGGTYGPDGHLDRSDANDAQPLRAPTNVECDTCDGSGLRTISGGGSGDPEWDADDQPCPECNPDYSRVRP